MTTPVSSPCINWNDAQNKLDEVRISELVRVGLKRDQKFLPPRLLYDGRGSKLYSQITRASEYYLSTAEKTILREYADDILQSFNTELVMTEPGAGDCFKTRELLEAGLSYQTNLLFEAIDVSRSQLIETTSNLTDRFKNLEVTAVHGTYRSGINHLVDESRPRLLIFLGSNIGNEKQGGKDLLKFFAKFMDPRDRLLVGIDLQKSPGIIEKAYNDEKNLNERFIKNILHRINRDLSGKFDPGAFRHDASYNPHKLRVEHYLISKQPQVVRIDDLQESIHFDENESISLGYSYKYSLDSFEKKARESNLLLENYWIDDNQYFADVLFRATQ